MNRHIRALIVAVALVAASVSIHAEAKGWEQVRTDMSGLNPVAHGNDIVVRVSPGQVVVSASQPVQIKVFTILGQVVSSETLQAGVSRLQLPHGVYIVKAGDLTCKIAV